MKLPSLKKEIKASEDIPLVQKIIHNTIKLIIIFNHALLIETVNQSVNKVHGNVIEKLIGQSFDLFLADDQLQKN
jgi:hypothetical protein